MPLSEKAVVTSEIKTISTGKPEVEEKNYDYFAHLKYICDWVKDKVINVVGVVGCSFTTGELYYTFYHKVRCRTSLRTQFSSTMATAKDN